MKKLLSIIILIGIIGLSIILRFWNLGHNPFWYGDECIYVTVVRNLINHQLRFEALNWTFFSAYLPQPPLFFLISAVFYAVINQGILALRVVAALSGVATTILLYFIGKELKNKPLGLWASYLFAIYPLSIIFTRWAFPYTFGMVWVTATLYFYIRYLNTKENRYLYFAGITTALGLFTIFYAGELALFLFVGMLLKKVARKKVWTVMSIAIVPIIVLFIIMLIFKYDSVLFDIKTAIWRSTQELAPQKNFWSLLQGYKRLWLLDIWFFCGILGLLFTERKYRPYLWLGFFCLSILPVARQGVVLDIFFYPLVICLPFIFIGLASFIMFLLDKTKINLEKGLMKLPAVSKPTRMLILATPTLIILVLSAVVIFRDIQQTKTVYIAKLNYFAVRNNQNILPVAEFLNKNTKPDDFVIAPASVYQFLQCNYASLFQSVAYTGKAIEYYPANIPQNRFKYPCSYFWAKYLVIAEIDRIDTLTKPAVKELWEKIQDDQWQKVYQLGEFEIYLNPLYKS